MRRLKNKKRKSLIQEAVLVAVLVAVATVVIIKTHSSRASEHDVAIKAAGMPRKGPKHRGLRTGGG
jgi:hypothetical protein